jgi:hypothetical protein
MMLALVIGANNRMRWHSLIATLTELREVSHAIFGFGVPISVDYEQPVLFAWQSDKSGRILLPPFTYLHLIGRCLFAPTVNANRIFLGLAVWQAIARFVRFSKRANWENSKSGSGIDQCNFGVM